MQENDFFTWRRAMLLRFQEMAGAEDVYTELQYQTQRLELIIMPCVFVIPSPLPGLKYRFVPLILRRG